MISRPTDIFFFLGIVCSQTAAILFGLSRGQQLDAMLCWLMFELGCLAGGIALSTVPRQPVRSQSTSAYRVLAQTIFAGLGWWTAADAPVVSNLVLPATICIGL